MSLIIMNENAPLSNTAQIQPENSDSNNNFQFSKDNKAPYILDSKREHELMAMAEKNLAPKVPQFRNFFIEQEVLQRQGFNSVISHQNLTNTRKNLIAGFDYVKSHAKNTNEAFLQEESQYLDLKHSKIGLKKEEIPIFKLITSHLTVQHASSTELELGSSLKSIRQREIEGETVTNQRTSLGKGRQNFIYGVTGLEEHVNCPGMEDLHTYRISLNKLALHNPNKFAQMYVSPHLAEFQENACCTPILMGETRINIEFDDKNRIITYKFDRKKEQVTLERVYHLNDFVFYGGEDVVNGISLRFIELLRFIGNPYRQHLLTCLSDPHRTEKQKIQQLGQALTALMPGWMIIEAKFPKEIVLDARYTEVVVVKKENNVFSWSDYLSTLTIDYTSDNDVDNNINSHSETEDTTRDSYFLKPLINALLASNFNITENARWYPLDDESEPPTETNSIDHQDIRQQTFIDLVEIISSEHCSQGVYTYERPSYTGYFPVDINLFFNKLILSEKEESLDLIKFILTASFKSTHDDQLYYLFNMNERDRTGTFNLFFRLLSVRNRQEKHKDLLSILYPHLHPTIFAHHFCGYVATAAHEAFGEVHLSHAVDFLLSKNIPISQDNEHLLNWINFENNEKLLEYIFIKQSLDINAVVKDYSWLEHAILLNNQNTIDWLVNHGAILHREHPKVVEAMTPDLKLRFNISSTVNVVQDDYPDAVVIIATAKYDNNETYAIMGRRRVSNKLELQWSFPGGLVEPNETALQAAIRELQEETTIIVPSNTPIRELMRIPLQERHQSKNKVNQIIFVHIDFGKSLLPSAWPDDDLGEIAKININRSKTNQTRTYKDLPVRVSNDLLLDKLNNTTAINTEEFSFLLFAEMYPEAFAYQSLRLLDKIEKGSSVYYFNHEYELLKDDPLKLEQLKQKTLALLENYLIKINHNTLDHDLRKSIFSSVVRSAQEKLAASLIKADFFKGMPIEATDLDICNLITCNKWDTLDFILTHLPSELKIDKDSWEREKPNDQIAKIPSQTIRQSIINANLINIVLDKLKSIYRKNARSNERVKICKEIKEHLASQPQLYGELTESHLKFILLSGDLELFKSCYQLPQFETFRFSSQYSYGFFKPGTYHSEDILQSLFKREHKEMLDFLNTNFSVYPSSYSYHYNQSDSDESIEDMNINAKN